MVVLEPGCFVYFSRATPFPTRRIYCLICDTGILNKKVFFLDFSDRFRRSSTRSYRMMVVNKMKERERERERNE